MHEYRGVRLRLYLDDAQRLNGEHAYAAIAHEAHRMGIAHGTVFRGIEGFGQSRHLHTDRLIEDSSALPVVVELVDRRDVVERFVPRILELLPRCTLTLTPVLVAVYGAGGAG